MQLSCHAMQPCALWSPTALFRQFFDGWHIESGCTSDVRENTFEGTAARCGKEFAGYLFESSGSNII